MNCGGAHIVADKVHKAFFLFNLNELFHIYHRPAFINLLSTLIFLFMSQLSSLIKSQHSPADSPQLGQQLANS